MVSEDEKLSFLLLAYDIYNLYALKRPVNRIYFQDAVSSVYQLVPAMFCFNSKLINQLVGFEGGAAHLDIYT